MRSPESLSPSGLSARRGYSSAVLAILEAQPLSPLRRPQIQPELSKQLATGKPMSEGKPDEGGPEKLESEQLDEGKPTSERRTA